MAARPGGNLQAESMPITLRPATNVDLDLLRRWDEQPHVRDAGGDWEANDFDWAYELPREVAWRALLIAMQDNRPIGFIQIIDPKEEETHYWGDCEPNLRAIDIWIGEAGDLGKGFGSEMMRLAIDACFADPSVTAIIIDPLANNMRAIRFYERLGFRFQERRVFHELDDCLVLRLTRKEWQRT